jgi:hypothetical protein
MQKPETIQCNTTGTTHDIKPRQLGDRVLQMRASLAASVSELVPVIVRQNNTAVLRQHLENTSYVSGSGGDGKQPGRRRSSHSDGSRGDGEPPRRRRSSRGTPPRRPRS